MSHVIAHLATLHSKRHYYNVEIKTPITGYHSKIDTVDKLPQSNLKAADTPSPRQFQPTFI